MDPPPSGADPFLDFYFPPLSGSDLALFVAPSRRGDRSGTPSV